MERATDIPLTCPVETADIFKAYFLLTDPDGHVV